jgi:histidinol-phosphatase
VELGRALEVAQRAVEAAAVASLRFWGTVGELGRLLAGPFCEGVTKLWDLAACQVLVEEAGGRLTDFDGSDSLASGNAAASNGHLHERVLEELRVKTGSVPGGR